MIIYIQEEQAYRAWVTNHRQGFVLDGRHRPDLGDFVLHRATCSHVKASHGQARQWTTDGQLKACSLQRDELERWVEVENQIQLQRCAHCHPEVEHTGDDQDPTRMAKLGHDVLDYVFESALIHLDSPDGPPYRVTVADIAECMGKTCGQITPSLKTLLENGFISLPGIAGVDTKLPPGRLVLPTPRAMQTLPAFAHARIDELQGRLDTLLLENC